MTKKVVKRVTADGRQRTAEPGLTQEQIDFVLEGKPASKPVAEYDIAVTVIVAFEWGLASAIREEVFHFVGQARMAEAAEFVRSVVEEGFWLKGQGQDPEYTFIPWHRGLTVRAPEGVAAAMSERKVAG